MFTRNLIYYFSPICSLAIAIPLMFLPLQLSAAVLILGSLTHFAMTFVYSYPRFKRGDLFLKLRFCAAVGVGVLFYYTTSDIYFLPFFFSLHWALSEAFLVDSEKRKWQHLFFRFAFYLSVYISLLSAQGVHNFISPFQFIGLQLFLFSASRWSSQEEWKSITAMNDFIFLILAATLLMLGKTGQLAVNAMVAYHGIVWTFHGGFQTWMSARKYNFAKYLVLTFGVLGALVVASYFGAKSDPQFGKLLYQQFVFWTYLHVATSFVLSDFNFSLLKVIRPLRKSQIG